MKWKKFKQALFHQGPSYEPRGNFRTPCKDDDVARWLKWLRDQESNGSDGYKSNLYPVLDWLLDEYRLHCDTGTPLNEHVCEYMCNCEGLEPPRWRRGEWVRPWSGSTSGR